MIEMDNCILQTRDELFMFEDYSRTKKNNQPLIFLGVLRIDGMSLRHKPWIPLLLIRWRIGLSAHVNGQTKI